MQDFNVMVKHLNTSFKYLQNAQVATTDRLAETVRFSRFSDLDRKATQAAIKLEDCLSYDSQNNVFQLNTIPLKILLLQDRRDLV